MINKSIDKLISYGLLAGLIEEHDIIYVRNKLLARLGIESYEESAETCNTLEELSEILKELTDYAVENGLIEDSIVYRDIFDTEIMDVLTPYPSSVIKTFNEKYLKSPKEATDYFYTLSCNNNYIRKDRIKKDIKWNVPSEYGEIEITINCSKPEKDPKAIATAKLQKQSSYPKCQLCIENEGYAGRVDHPARQNHRIIPIKICDERWGFQFSPYVYYNEHCILLNSKHTPMVIDKSVFSKLLDFIRQFPHYIIGSNADLPIVGGSILTHEHFQGGNHIFAMHRAKSEKFYNIKGYENVEVSRLKWPLSVIRLSSKDKDEIVELSDRILNSWRNYTDENMFIYARSNGEPHNTITPIASMNNDKYIMDLVLRNNITTDEHPLGVYHPHKKLHHIKKENIGLIEVMGLAVLPSRLVEELDAVADAIIKGLDMSKNEKTASHKEWAEKVVEKHTEINADNIDSILKEEVGKVFVKVLEHAGVYKRMFECLMQQTPNMSRANQEEKRFKAQYIGVLKDYMREYGYGNIRKRVLNSLDKFIFDEFIFCNEEHRDTFWRMYTRWAKNADKKNLDTMAIIYLLSTHREFGTILANYVSNPLYVLPKTYSGGNDEEKYNIYHAVKMLAGMESGLEEADLFEDEIINDKILCLIINAKFISKYGINGYQDKKNRRKEPYINNSSKHRRNQKLFSYKGQTIRIK